MNYQPKTIYPCNHINTTIHHTLSACALLYATIMYTYITISISIEIRICRIYALLNYLIKPEGTPFSDTLYVHSQMTLILYMPLRWLLLPLYRRRNIYILTLYMCTMCTHRPHTHTHTLNPTRKQIINNKSNFPNGGCKVRVDIE